MELQKLTDSQQSMISIFTKALPALRKELCVSQSMLGSKIGLSRQTISAIERGMVPMTWCTFLSVFLFFKINYNKDKQSLNELEKFLMVDKARQQKTPGCSL